MRGGTGVCAGVCVCVCVCVCVMFRWVTVYAYLSTHTFKSSPIDTHCILSHASREKWTHNDTIHRNAQHWSIYVPIPQRLALRDAHTVLPGPSGRPRRASQCGRTWAEVPARRQGFVCHTRSTPGIARTQCTRTRTPTDNFHLYTLYMQSSHQRSFSLALCRCVLCFSVCVCPVCVYV